MERSQFKLPNEQVCTGGGKKKKEAINGFRKQSQHKQNAASRALREAKI